MLRWTARQPCKHCSMYCRRSLSVHGHGRARQRCDENTFSCFTFTSMWLPRRSDVEQAEGLSGVKHVYAGVSPGHNLENPEGLCSVRGGCRGEGRSCPQCLRRDPANVNAT